MTEKRVTEKSIYEEMLRDEYVAKHPAWVGLINKKLGIIAKRKSNGNKPTANQKENVLIVNEMRDKMKRGKRYTITQLLGIITTPTENPLTNQRLSQICNRLAEAGQMTRIVDKRVAYFSFTG